MPIGMCFLSQDSMAALLENNAAKPSYNYKPPLIQNGKVINGQFAK